MSLPRLNAFNQSWGRQWTLMADRHYDERTECKQEAESEKNNAIEKARLQVADLHNRGISSTALEEEIRKIYAERDSTLELIEKGYDERMCIIQEIQQREAADHHKAHHEAIAARSFMNNPLSLHAAAVAANADDGVALKRGDTPSTAQASASESPGPASGERMRVGDALGTPATPAERDRPAIDTKRTNSAIIRRSTASRQEQSLLINTSGDPLPTPIATATENDAKDVAGSKTVMFEDVYQNGQAEHKDTIIEYPQGSRQWYILKCEEHEIRFNQRPLMGAAKHLNGKEHGCMEKGHALAIKQLGYRVLGCNARLAALNNTAVSEAYANGYKPEHRKPKRSKSEAKQGTAPGTGSLASVPSQDSLLPSLKRRQRSGTISKEILTNPKAFHIYYCLWKSDRCHYPVMILGWDDLKPGGLDNLAKTGLLDKKSYPPKCYTYKNMGSATDAAIAGWAPGFEDGGPNVNKRKFPAMFFDPNQEVGWVSAKWLSKFPLYDPDPPKKESDPFNVARRWVAQIAGFASWDEFKKREGEKGRNNASLQMPALSSNMDNSDESGNDSDSTGSAHSAGSKRSGVTEAELQQLQDKAGEISGDSNYAESGKESNVMEVDGELRNTEDEGQSSAFYNLPANTRKAGLPKPVNNGTPRRTKIRITTRGGKWLNSLSIETHAREEENSEAGGSKAESSSRGKAPKGATESSDRDDGDHSPSIATASDPDITPTTSEAASSLRASASPSHTPEADGIDGAGRNSASNPTKDTPPCAESPKGTKRPRSEEFTDENGSSSEQENPKRSKTGKDTVMKMSEAISLPSTSEGPASSSFAAKSPLGPPAFELISYSKGSVSWERANKESSLKLFYSEDNKMIGTVDAPMDLVIDSMTLATLTQEKIPGDSKGNSMVTLMTKDANDVPMRLVFDRARGSKTDIGKIQVRGFIRWLKGVNPSLRLPQS